jgi:hypothetical protein
MKITRVASTQGTQGTQGFKGGLPIFTLKINE